MPFRMASLFILLCMYCLGGASGAAEGESTTEIRRVSFASRADGSGLVIRLHANEPVAAYSEPRLQDDNQLEFVFQLQQYHYVMHLIF